MLKIARREKDRRSNDLMTWWNGDGAAKVLIHDERAILMERATDASSLAEMARGGHDGQAILILCNVIRRLHDHQPPFPAALIPLDLWFDDLRAAASKYGGTFAECASVAATLIDDQQDIVALHGDIHHGNVLDFGDRGWLAIDPKGLVGDRGFDYANIFCNPDGATALRPGRLSCQTTIAAAVAGLGKRRLLQWIAAWAGLSAAWCMSDRQDSQHAIGVARIALGEAGY